jgi:Pin2-interacting protein X1
LQTDASRFGSEYLSKFGWDSSKGLGVAGDGRTSHIKVSHKLDMLGIGAANMHDPNGIAWKQNKDFENLLRRLNEVADGAGEEDVGTNVEGFVSQGKGDDVPGETVERVDEVEKGEKKRKRKERARMDSENEDQDAKNKEKDSELEEGGKRKRKDKKDKEHKSKKRKTSKSGESSQETPIPSAPPIIPRHRP